MDVNKIKNEISEYLDNVIGRKLFPKEKNDLGCFLASKTKDIYDFKSTSLNIKSIKKIINELELPYVVSETKFETMNKKNNVRYFIISRYEENDDIKMDVDIYGIIYMIRNNINNKVYIGQTIQGKGFDDRYNGDWVKYTHNKHLKNSVNKYGIDNFTIIKQYDVAYSKEELDNLERKYIKQFKSNNLKYGYNSTAGGESTPFGDPKPVICLNTREVYKSVNDAARDKNVFQNLITGCCNLRFNNAGRDSETGEFLKWARLDYYDESKYFNDGIKNYLVNSRAILCLDTNIIYYTATEAGLKNGVVSSSITRNIKGKSRYAGKDENGYKLHWKLLSDI